MLRCFSRLPVDLDAGRQLASGKVELLGGLRVYGGGGGQQFITGVVSVGVVLLLVLAETKTSDGLGLIGFRV